MELSFHQINLLHFLQENLNIFLSMGVPGEEGHNS